jgi:ribosome biogenesis GTPase
MQLKKGLVIKSTGSWYAVKDADGQIISCKIRGKFRSKGIRTTNPLAVGDWVQFETEANAESGIITGIEPRKNYIIRRSINLSKQAHILAANVDQAILLVTLAKPRTYPEFIDRFLVSAEAYGISAKIVFNKVDLYGNEELNELKLLKKLYENIGYPCFEISAKNQQGVDNIEQLLAGKISVISGHSGVGKSTLINAIEPLLALKTSEISSYHDSGKHTTTFPEMYSLSNSGYIIDTPGVKGFGVIDLEKEEISHFFPEMFAVLEHCQYYNCTHSHEPNCAVKQAVKDGEISQSRYRSYINLLVGDENEKFRSTPY